MAFLQKFKIPLLILLFLGGLGFIVFAVFFNRATIRITAEAPYSIQILNLRTVDCPENDCTVSLAPGIYQITLTKADYQSMEDSLDLKLGENLEKKYIFKLIPKTQPIGTWNSGKIFNQKPYLLNSLLRVDLTQPASFWTLLENSLSNFDTIDNFQVASSGENYLVDNSKEISLIQLQQGTPEVTPIPSGQAFFYTPDNSQVVYLADDRATLDQTLYALNLSKRPFQPEPITTFLRKINTYHLIPNSAFTHIALLDQSNAEQVGLYIVDLKSKTRKLIISEPNILDFQWLEQNILQNSKTDSSPGQTSSFLIQKRNPVTYNTEIYRGNIDQSTLDSLPIQNDLSNLLIIDNSNLIYTTALSENTESFGKGFSFQKMNLETKASELIFTTEELQEPTKIQYDSSAKRLLFLSGDTIYSLSLTL